MITALLVTSAATLLESAPFILAAVVCTSIPLRWNARLVPYLGCGCGTGPSARSLPAAAATWLVFGPLVAGARLAAAILVERFARRAPCHVERESLLAQLHAVLLPACAGALAVCFIPAISGMQKSMATAMLGGALAAFVSAPCGLGSVALAASLRSVLPPAAAGFLCVAGIIDVRTWIRAAHERCGHDALAYTLAAVACALVAARTGAALVHPAFVPALWICAAACAALAYKHRRERNAWLRVAPVVMLLGSVLAAPPPEYHATETTLGDAFAGERIDFTGVATQTGGTTTLVRYAITCCRADAAPIVVALERSINARGWMHARGVLMQTREGLRLRANSLQKIAAPPDPFVYR